MPDGDKSQKPNGGESGMSEAMIVGGLLSAFGKLVHAYEESKRIDAQMAAIKADYRIKARALVIKQEELELRHKENMEVIKCEKEKWLRFFEQVQKNVKVSIEDRKEARRQTDDILKCALDSQLPQEERAMYALMYKEAWGMIMGMGNNVHDMLIRMKPNSPAAIASNKPKEIEE